MENKFPEISFRIIPSAIGKVPSDLMIKIDFEVPNSNRISNFTKLDIVCSFCDKVVQCQQILEKALERTEAECLELFIIEIILE